MFIKFEIQDALVLAVKWYLLFYSWRGSAAKHWDLSPKLWDQKFNHSHSRREPYAIDERSCQLWKHVSGRGFCGFVAGSVSMWRPAASGKACR